MLKCINKSIFYILLMICISASGCAFNDLSVHMTSASTEKSEIDLSLPGDEQQETVRFNNIIKIPDDVAFDYSEISASFPEYLETELVYESRYIWHARYEPPYVIYGHEQDGKSLVTMYNFSSKTSSGFETRTKLRRYIRKASFDSRGYSYLSAFENEPHIWHYFRFDTINGETVDYFDMNEITGKSNINVSDVEEEGNLLAWTGETDDGRNLYIAEMTGDKPNLIHTLKLNTSANTLTPLTIRNQCVSYSDWNPDTQKWYIRTYDAYKGEHAIDTCDFELTARPESPPAFDRDLLVWLENREESNFLYIYSRYEDKKYLIDTQVQNPMPYYPYISYVKDGRLYSFDIRNKKKLALFDSSNEKVIMSEGGIMPYCYTEGEGYARIYMLRLQPEPEEEKMRYKIGSDGVVELERENAFLRYGIGSCTILYNGEEHPEIFAHETGFPLAEICSVLKARLEIQKSSNVLGDDVPEQFTVSREDIRLTFTGKAIKNAQGDGGASYDCIELPHLKATFYKGKIQIDLPDLLDALKISWIADTNQNILYINDTLPEN